MGRVGAGWIVGVEGWVIRFCYALYPGCVACFGVAGGFGIFGFK